jgi:hypothetical protein
MKRLVSFAEVVAWAAPREPLAVNAEGRRSETWNHIGIECTRGKAGEIPARRSKPDTGEHVDVAAPEKD